MTRPGAHASATWDGTWLDHVRTLVRRGTHLGSAWDELWRDSVRAEVSAGLAKA